MVRKLAAARAQVDKTTTRGHTPLHYAAWGGAWRKGIFSKRVWTSEMAIVAIALVEYSQIVYYSRQPGKTQLIHGCTPAHSQCQCHVIVSSMCNHVQHNSKAPRFSCLESFHFSRSLGSDTSIAGSWSRQTFVRSEQARCQCLFHGSDSRHLGLFKQRCR